jgi:hypothetical protein
MDQARKCSVLDDGELLADNVPCYVDMPTTNGACWRCEALVGINIAERLGRSRWYQLILGDGRETTAFISALIEPPSDAVVVFECSDEPKVPTGHW